MFRKTSKGMEFYFGGEESARPEHFLPLPAGAKKLEQVVFVPEEYCGWPGIAHGGILAAMLDEGMCFVVYGNLKRQCDIIESRVSFRAPAKVMSPLILIAELIKTEDNKVEMKGKIINQEDNVLIAESIAFGLLE